jgi:hypothetical protein
VDPGGAGGVACGQRVRRDRSRSSGSAGRFAGCDTDSGQCVPICQRVQVRDGARHLVSAPTCRAIACPDFRTLDRVHRRSGPPVVVATTRTTAPRLSGSRRARNRRSADDDRLAEAHLLEGRLNWWPTRSTSRRTRACSWWTPTTTSSPKGEGMALRARKAHDRRKRDIGCKCRHPGVRFEFRCVVCQGHQRTRDAETHFILECSHMHLMSRSC